MKTKLEEDYHKYKLIGEEDPNMPTYVMRKSYFD